MSLAVEFTGPNWGILLHPDWAQQLAAEQEEVSPLLFKPSHYGQMAKPVAEGGRNAAWFVSTGVGPAVLRQYRRGGLVAKFNRSRYLFTSAAKTRSFQEFEVMNYLHQAGLSVPQPLGAYYERQGLLCTMSFVTRLVHNAQSLASICQQWLDAKLSDEKAFVYAERAAQCIHQMHDLDIWHADLNAYNILCVEEPLEVYLIDFDRAKRQTLTQQQRQQNLDRLQRSLIKCCGEQSIVFMEQISRNYQLFNAK